MYLWHVATAAAQASVGISWILFFFLAFTSFILVTFLRDALFSHIHEVDVLLSGVVVDGGGEFGPFFVAVHGGKGIFQLDVGVVGVIEWRDLVLSVIDVHRDLEARVFEELAQLQVGGDIESRPRLKGVVGDTAVQGTEAC